jgi:hypothetical protein
MAGGAAGPISLFQRRPAETTTAIAGVLGVIAVALFGDGGADFETAFLLLLSFLPALVSRLHDLGRFGPDGKRVAHDVSKELDEFALRTVRRARLGHPSWEADAATLKQLADTVAKANPAAAGGAPGSAPPADPAPAADKKEKG